MNRKSVKSAVTVEKNQQKYTFCKAIVLYERETPMACKKVFHTIVCGNVDISCAERRKIPQGMDFPRFFRQKGEKKVENHSH